MMIAVTLEREDAEKKLKESRPKVGPRDMELEARLLWDTVNGNPGEPLYAGDFEQHVGRA